jgi:serine/threonine protein kinase
MANNTMNTHSTSASEASNKLSTREQRMFDRNQRKEKEELRAATERQQEVSVRQRATAAVRRVTKGVKTAFQKAVKKTTAQPQQKRSSPRNKTKTVNASEAETKRSSPRNKNKTVNANEAATKRTTRSMSKREADQQVNAITKQTPVTPARTKSTVARSPEGIVIREGDIELEIEELIGKGAEKSVHRCRNKNTGEIFAAKIVPSPPKKGKKKRKSKAVQETIENAKALRDEYVLLKALEGSPQETKIVPKVLHYAVGLDGFDVSVVEIMPTELLAIVPKLVEEARRRGIDVDFSVWAISLIDMSEALHKKGFVNVDIKPENVMLDADGLPCFVDLGLARPIADEEVYNIGAGTPAFMALSAHKQSPSPREDIESTIYMLAEIFLRTMAAIDGEELKSTEETYLPWDLAASEAVIWREKFKHVKDSESSFYKTMPEDAARLFMQALKLNWECKYAEEPKYDQLRAILSKLRAPLKGDGNHQQRPSAPVVAARTKVAARICLPRRCRCNPSPVLRRL